jgi:hypothetical protein
VPVLVAEDRHCVGADFDLLESGGIAEGRRPDPLTEERIFEVAGTTPATAAE